MSRLSYILLFSAAFLVRIAAAAVSNGFGSDTACFAAWANRIYELGAGGFYAPDVFTDYPPGYMYLLYPIGAISANTGMRYLGSAHLILLRLPSILSDLFCGALLAREGKRKLRPEQAFFVCAAYLFNPAVILNSSIWGQVDSVFTLALLLMCVSLVRGKMFPAYLAYGAALFIKPQALLLGPVIFLGFLDRVILKDFSVRKLLHNLGQILGVLLTLVLLCLPFGLSNVWKQYFSTIGSYPYASVNAYNLWALLGKSWVNQNEPFLGLPCRVWGSLMIMVTVLAAFSLSIRKKKDTTKYPFLGAFLLIGIFVFSVRMHERYLFPALLFLLLSFIYRPGKSLFYCYCGFSLMHFFNTFHVLFYYNPSNYDPQAPAILLISAGTLFMAVYFFFFCCRQWLSDGTTAWELRLFPLPKQNTYQLDTYQPTPSAKPLPFKRAEWLFLLAVTLIYSCLAIYDLGDRKAPETALDMTTRQEIVLDFDGRIPASLHYYIAPWHDREFLLEEKHPEDDIWLSQGSITLENVFTWQELPLTLSSSQLRLTLTTNQASLLELVFLDADGNVLLPENAGDYPALFDESALLPARSSFRNSMYFDEIYHGRTAYEFLHGLYSYENTHPPLGKLLIALGVAVCGMNPFGWRIMGVLFGIAMVPLSYLFARRLTRNIPAAVLACLLFTFDFMHFTQTRIATIDVYITFFVMLMYYFMYCYSRLSFYDNSLKKTLLPLGACGISMGLGIACKWTGVYAGLGLAVLFFAVLYRRLREYLYAAKDPSGCSRGISHSHILSVFRPCAVKTLLFCVVFFVAIPAGIYLLSYLPFRDTSQDGLFFRMLRNQETMLSYHSGLNATHPYSSAWYEWPIIRRPIWYFSAILTGSSGSGGLREGISAFGNPAVWWIGIPAALYTLYLWAKKKDRTAAFLTIGYLAQYLPWFFVTRITFIYHYFPSVLFVVLMIVYSLIQWRQRLTRKRFLLICTLYAALAILLFCLFYPVLSGQPVHTDFVAKWLRWFDSWVLVAG